MRYCNRCVMPDTKPGLSLDEEGICSACRSYEKRTAVDWDRRKKELETILQRYKSPKGSHWDCIVPVSGGKDSTYQVVRMLQMGMNPLCVTATTCDLTDLGRKNLENIKNLGVDSVEFSPNPLVRRKLNRIGLTMVGDISWPEHAGIFTIPVKAAVQYNIPLIVWVRTPRMNTAARRLPQSNVLNRKWLEEFGGSWGCGYRTFRERKGIEPHHLLPIPTPRMKNSRQRELRASFSATTSGLDTATPSYLRPTDS
ncbi:hypothetical protein MASR1M66_22420 [Aminivibrio sp.]